MWDEVDDGSPFLAVLRKPNRFQTRIQFFNYWIVSKLMAGNTYILKDRDQQADIAERRLVSTPAARERASIDDAYARRYNKRIAKYTARGFTTTD